MTGVARLLPSSSPRRARPPRLAQRLDLHDPRPVLAVAVRDQQQDRRPERRPCRTPADDLGPVVLDRLARAAAVAALAPGQVDGEAASVSEQPGRHALDDHPERRAVGFARGQEAQSASARAVSPAWRPRSARLRRPSAAGRRGLGDRRAPASSPAGSPSADRTPSARARASACSSPRVARLAGPERERRGALVEEHQLAVERRRPAASASREPRPLVDQVEHEQVAGGISSPGSASCRRSGRSTWR